MTFKQAHMPIREALDAYKGLSQFKYEVFLQGPYKNDTNLGGDSDVHIVVRLTSKLGPSVVALSGEQLQKDGFYRFALERRESFRDASGTEWPRHRRKSNPIRPIWNRVGSYIWQT